MGRVSLQLFFSSGILGLFMFEAVTVLLDSVVLVCGWSGSCELFSLYIWNGNSTIAEDKGMVVNIGHGNPVGD